MPQDLEGGPNSRRRDWKGIERYVDRTYAKIQRDLELTKRAMRAAERQLEANKREAALRRREVRAFERDLVRVRKARDYLRRATPKRAGKRTRIFTFFKAKPFTLFSDYLDLMRWADDGGRCVGD